MSAPRQIKRAATGEERTGKAVGTAEGGGERRNIVRVVMGVLTVTFVTYSLAVTFLFGILTIVVI